MEAAVQMCRDWLDQADQEPDNTKPDLEVDLTKIEGINEVIRSDSHFPSFNSESFLKRKCQMLLAEGDEKGAGLTLLNSQYLSFRHQGRDSPNFSLIILKFSKDKSGKMCSKGKI
jgi:hypothetical protein